MDAQKKRALLFVSGLGLVGWFLDQLTKYLAVAHLTRLMPDEAGLFARLGLFFGTDELEHLATAPAQILAPVWEHLYVQNPAGAFSFLLGAPPLVRRSVFLVAALLATGGILYLAWRSPAASRLRVLLPLGLLLAGALGNFTDRALHGYVIDFIHWHHGTFSWPPFNIADACIVVGAITLVLFGGAVFQKPGDPSDKKSKKGKKTKKDGKKKGQGKRAK